MIETVAVALSANALVLAALTFLLRSLIGHRLEKDITQFKQDIELTAQREIEAYKGQLEKDRLRLQISYGGIFEKQANAIHELYRGVIALERAASTAVNSGGTVPERREAFRQPWAAVRLLHHDNRILLSQDIDDALARFIDEMFINVLGPVHIQVNQMQIEARKTKEAKWLSSLS